MPRDQDDLILGEAGAVNGPDQRPQHDAVAASRTPDVRELFFMAQVFVD